LSKKEMDTLRDFALRARFSELALEIKKCQGRKVKLLFLNNHGLFKDGHLACSKCINFLLWGFALKINLIQGRH
jgi:hypothetical protein